MNSALKAAARAILAIVGTSFLIAGEGRANDSTASIDAGGIHFLYNDKIELKEEDLYLSRRQVRVRYVFENKSDRDIKTIVAFPLPEISTGEAGNYAIQAGDPVNFIGFEVSVDGRRIAPSVDTRATSNGVDVTSLLAKSGLPLTTITADTAAQDRLYARLRKLPEAAIEELERYGAVDRLSSSGQGLPDVNPRWVAHITFYWEQTFPAGRRIEVTHKYRPVPREFLTGLEQLGSAGMRKEYCIDEAFWSGAKAMASKGTLNGTELRYIVTTAGNWFGPIGRFNLTIDKEDPKRIISTCVDGIKKIGPTTFGVSKQNYSPTKDLGVLILERVSAP